MNVVETEGKKDIKAAERLTRLHVNLNRRTAERLKEVAERRELTVTEAVRQAVGTWAWLDQAMQNGARIQLVEDNGVIREIMLLDN